MWFMWSLQQCRRLAAVTDSGLQDLSSRALCSASATPRSYWSCFCAWLGLDVSQARCGEVSPLRDASGWECLFLLVCECFTFQPNIGAPSDHKTASTVFAFDTRCLRCHVTVLVRQWFLLFAMKLLQLKHPESSRCVLYQCFPAQTWKPAAPSQLMWARRAVPSDRPLNHTLKYSPFFPVIVRSQFDLCWLELQHSVILMTQFLPGSVCNKSATCNRSAAAVMKEVCQRKRGNLFTASYFIKCLILDLSVKISLQPRETVLSIIIIFFNRRK